MAESRPKPMGSVYTKKQNEKKYDYYAYYKDGKKTDIYCGIQGKAETKRKIMEAELEEMEHLKEYVLKRIKTLTKALNR